MKTTIDTNNEARNAKLAAAWLGVRGLQKEHS